MGRPERQKRRKVYTFTSAAEAYRPPRLVGTGIVALDAAIGGGIPCGRFVEVHGPFKGGKTALAYEIARAFQQAGGRARWTDAEHAFDGFAFERFGGDLKSLDFDEATDTVEEYVHKAEDWIGAHARESCPKIDVLDSVAALGTVHENTTDMTTKNLDRAGQIYRGFRRLGGKVSRSATTLLLVNQVRERVGVFFGNPETTTGGKGPEFFSTLRLRIAQGTLKKGKRVRVLDGGGLQVGIRVVVRVVKNRLVPSDGVEAELLYRYSSGFDAVAGVLRLLADRGVIRETTRGSDDGVEAFEHDGKVIRDEEVFVDEHPELLRELWSGFVR